MCERYNIVAQHGKEMSRSFEAVSMELQRVERDRANLHRAKDELELTIESRESELTSLKRNLAALAGHIQDAEREIRIKKCRIADLEEDTRDTQDRIEALNAGVNLWAPNLRSCARQSVKTPRS